VKEDDTKSDVQCPDPPKPEKRWLRYTPIDAWDGHISNLALIDRSLMEEETYIFPQKAIEYMDREVLKRFLFVKRIPEYEEELRSTFEWCRPAFRAEGWFDNIDKIVLGEYPLEKVPEYLQDIVKDSIRLWDSKTGAVARKDMADELLAYSPWTNFQGYYVEDCGWVKFALYSRISLMDIAEELGATLHYVDREVVRYLYFYDRDYDRTWGSLGYQEEFREELVATFDHCRRYQCNDFWFFNLDKIILGDYPLEKLPNYLHDIVKEARSW